MYIAFCFYAAATQTFPKLGSIKYRPSVRPSVRLNVCLFVFKILLLVYKALNGFRAKFHF